MLRHRFLDPLLNLVHYSGQHRPRNNRDFEKKLQFVRQYFQAIALLLVCSSVELLTLQLALTVPIFFPLPPLLSLKQQYLIRLNY